MDIYNSIGQQIKTARKEMGIGQKVLASTLGYTPSTISQYESGKRCILLTDLDKIAIALNRPLPYFITPGERSREKKKPGLYISLKQYRMMREAHKLQRKIKATEYESEKQKEQIKKLDGKIQKLLTRIAEQAQLTHQTATLYNELKKNEQKVREAEKIVIAHQTTETIAYQLNNPLTIVLGFLQMLISDTHSESTSYKDLKKTENAVRRCTEIMARLVTSFSK